MLILDSFESLAEALDKQQCCLTIGVFDGVHIGHQALLTHTIQTAIALNVPAVAVTFSNHPLSVLAPPYAPRSLVTPQRKAQLMQSFGIDYLLLLEFTSSFAAITAEQFVLHNLLQQARMKKLIFGYDFTFGAEGKGNVDLLKKLATDHPFELESLSAISSSNIEVKSTHIRDLLANGKVTQAARLLTRPHEVPGLIVHGKQRGRTIGFPTANLKPPSHYQLPARGVYACYARVASQPELYRAMVNIGFSPTFGENDYTIEAHILDFNSEIHGQEMSLFFMSRLRDEQKFPSADALVAQLNKDRQSAAIALGAEENLKIKMLIPPGIAHGCSI